MEPERLKAKEIVQETDKLIHIVISHGGGECVNNSEATIHYTN